MTFEEWHEDQNQPYESHTCPHYEWEKVAWDAAIEQLRGEAPNERLIMWVLDLGFATGHADTEQDLLNEVGAQIKELQAKYDELLYGVAR